MNPDIRLTYGVTELDFCCGIRETGDYRTSLGGRIADRVDCYLPYGVIPNKIRAGIVKEWGKEINTLLRGNRPLLFTLCKQPDQVYYDNQCLVDAINEHPGALDCGSSINPNTGNTVTVYMIYPPQKGKK